MLKFWSRFFSFAIAPMYFFMDGGSASSSQTLSNIINYNPVLQSGNDNESDLSSELEQKATSRAENREDLGLSAGVALGPNSSAMGGAVSRPATAAGMADAGGAFSVPTYTGGSSNTLWLAGAAAVGLLAFMLGKKKS